MFVKLPDSCGDSILVADNLVDVAAVGSSSVVNGFSGTIGFIGAGDKVSDSTESFLDFFILVAFSVVNFSANLCFFSLSVSVKCLISLSSFPKYLPNFLADFLPTSCFASCIGFNSSFKPVM